MKLKKEDKKKKEDEMEEGGKQVELEVDKNTEVKEEGKGRLNREVER